MKVGIFLIPILPILFYFLDVQDHSYRVWHMGLVSTHTKNVWTEECMWIYEILKNIERAQTVPKINEYLLT